MEPHNSRGWPASGVHRLRSQRGRAEGLVFTSQRGTPLSYRNTLGRAFKPAAEEAGAGWAGFHTLRHTFASLHIARGTNIVQLSRMLGHHSPDFTLRVYAHLIPGDEVKPLDLDAELPHTKVIPIRRTQPDPTEPQPEFAETAQ